MASAFAVPALGNAGIDKAARICLIANASVAPLIGIVYFYPVFSVKLLFLGFPWAITAPLFMLMLALALRRRQDPAGPA